MALASRQPCPSEVLAGNGVCRVPYGLQHAAHASLGSMTDWEPPFPLPLLMEPLARRLIVTSEAMPSKDESLLKYSEYRPEGGNEKFKGRDDRLDAGEDVWPLLTVSLAVVEEDILAMIFGPR